MHMKNDDGNCGQMPVLFVTLLLRHLALQEVVWGPGDVQPITMTVYSRPSDLGTRYSLHNIRRKGVKVIDKQL